MPTLKLEQQEFKTPGDYTASIPADCVGWGWLTAIGGGGAGGPVSNNVLGGSGGGGSGESCHNLIIELPPSTGVAVHVGAGGAQGGQGILATNVHAGPPENSTSFRSGFGGEPTTVGQITVRGGYGGIGGSNSPHGGMGGGFKAYRSDGISASGNPNNGEGFSTSAGGPGSQAGSIGGPFRPLDGPRFTAGSGGAAASNITASPSSPGGPFGPYPGGAGGATTGSTTGGGGGGASPWGPGGAGGAGKADAPAVPAGSYGAGGGGSGGNDTDTSPPFTTKYFGAKGGDGYVLLSYYRLIP